MESIQCTVTTIYFPKKGQPQPENGYAIIAASLKGQGTVKLKGGMPGVRTRATINVEGRWSSDSYGKVFLVSRYEEVLPESTEGIRTYLSSGLIKGIGPSTAKLIVEAFGEKTIEVLDTTPERLYEIKGIGKKKTETIIANWAEQKGIRELMVFLKNYDVPGTMAAKIYKTFGDESVLTVRTRPYDICFNVEGIGFPSVDRIALDMGFKPDDQERIKAALLYSLSSSCNEDGHSFLLRDDLFRAALNLLDTPLTQERMDICLTMLSYSKAVILTDEGKVYLPAFFYAERDIATKVTLLLLHEEKPMDIDFERLRKECLLEFEPVQEDAIRTVFRSHVSIITGGPGTGKTTTVKGIIRQAHLEHRQVILAAPTGRAAKRLAESTGMEAKTIHRLLEYTPGCGFGRNAENPLEGSLLVVDESSMLDLMLTQALMKAVPKSMRVVLVGDIDQLPSVGPGNILRDLIGCELIPVTRLTTIFRQKSQSSIITAAHSINNGQVPPLLNTGGDFLFVEDRSSEQGYPEALQTHLLDLVQSCPQGADSLQVLSPMRRGPLGTIELNRLLQERLNPQAVGLLRGTTEFRVGDRVMQTRNDYENWIFNGDTGRVTQIDTEERSVTVDFDGNDVTLQGEKLDNLDLAYCMTVHKSQGSEYPQVIIPIVKTHRVMLVRNLLYTAVTRARQGCVLLGESDAVRMAVENNTVRKRNSSLVEMLLEAYGRYTRRQEQAG